MSKALSRYLIWRVSESAEVGGIANLRTVAALSGRGEAGTIGQSQGVSMVSKDISLVISFYEISVNICPTFLPISIFGGTITPLTTQQFPFSIWKTTLRFISTRREHLNIFSNF